MNLLRKIFKLMPYKVKENGDILYSMYEGLHSHGKIHLSCYGFCSDSLDRIIRWHFRDTQRGYSAATSSKYNGWEIEVSTSCVKIYKELECKGVFSLD